MDTLNINSIKEKLGIVGIEFGISQIREVDADLSSGVKDETIFTIPLDKIDSKITFTPQDSKYYCTSYDNIQKIISLLNPIAKLFPWEAERFDCDNRANLMSSLVSALYRLNTCSVLYCNVYDANTDKLKYQHSCNLWVDDSGNLYLWDVDQGGIYQKVTGQNMIMGVNKYYFIGDRAY